MFVRNNIRNTVVVAVVCVLGLLTAPITVDAFSSMLRSPSPPLLATQMTTRSIRLSGFSQLKVSTLDVEETAIAGADASFSPVDVQAEKERTDELTRKVINGLFLAATFGYALFTILNIDHEITRGWTQSEIAMRIPLDNWSNYESSLESKPVFTKTLINVIIYLLGDWLSQTVFQKKNALDFDVSRTLRNGFIGLCFGPLVHQYYEFSDHILPVEGGIMNRVEKIFMDQTIYLTVKCSIYISAVGLLQGDDWSTVKQNVKDRIGGIVFTAWKFWPLVHCITYSLIPARHRILWVNSVDLVWNAILASKVTEDKVTEEVMATTEEMAFESSSAIEQLANSGELLLTEVVESLSNDDQYAVVVDTTASTVNTFNGTDTSMVTV